MATIRTIDSSCVTGRTPIHACACGLVNDIFVCAGYGCSATSRHGQPFTIASTASNVKDYRTTFCTSYDEGSNRVRISHESAARYESSPTIPILDSDVRLDASISVAVHMQPVDKECNGRFNAVGSLMHPASHCCLLHSAIIQIRESLIVRTAGNNQYCDKYAAKNPSPDPYCAEIFTSAGNIQWFTCKHCGQRSD